MQIKTFSIYQLILKLLIYGVIFYFAVIATSLLITGYLFISLNSYTSRIEKVVQKHTGYKLKVGSLQTKLNKYFLPELIIKNTTLINPSNTKQNFNIGSLELVLSYSSIWNLEPIFSEINIDDTIINLEYKADGEIFINGINISRPSSTSTIDLENWLLKQGKISLSNINFSFLDQKNNLPKFELKKIRANLSNNSFMNSHTFDLAINSENNIKVISADLEWTGGKISQFTNWQEATLNIQTYNKKDKISNSLQKYLPKLTLLKEFKAQSALKAQIKQGKLQFLYANFDIKNLQYAVKDNPKLINFPTLGGSLKINLIDQQRYQLTANNLTISTSHGNILNNKSINGSYFIKESGSISIDKLNLALFNPILPLLSQGQDFSLNGTIDIIKFNWLGNIFKPSNYSLYSKFTNLSIISKSSDIPSLNNVSGDININNEGGKINLALKDSILNYDKIFLTPFKLKSLITQINWTFNKDHTIEFKFSPTDIQTNDFTGIASGSYTYKTGTSGYLNLNAKVNQILISKVGGYLPKQIDMDVHRWLDMALINGYGLNGTLKLEGNLDDFPFAKNNGVFYIDADIKDGKLRYAEDWPIIDQVDAKFAIRNQKIIVTTNSAKIIKNDINNAIVIIPDITANKVYLTADGNANGSTQNFLDYLAKTPVNKIIGEIPQNTKATGNGQVAIHLKVPFDNPNKTQVSGNYIFDNNKIKFDLPVPILTEVNGQLFFTDNGLSIESITANVFNSLTTLETTTSSNNIMHFKAHSKDLDYKALANFYLPFMSKVINGNSPTDIYFDIGEHGLNKLWGSSKLTGVSLNAPEPLDTTGALNFNMNLLNKKFNIDFDFNNILFGQFKLNESGEVINGKLGLGTKKFAKTSLTNYPIRISANLNNTYIADWLELVNNLTNSESNDKTIEHRILNNKKSKNIEKPSHFLPIEVLLYTNNLYLEKYNFESANVRVLVQESNSLFAFNSNVTQGRGIFNYSKKKVDLFADRFNLHTKNESVVFTKFKQKKISLLNSHILNTSQVDLAYESNVFNNNLDFSKDKNPIIVNMVDSLGYKISPLNLPIINLNIKKLYVENHQPALLNVSLVPSGYDLLIESGILLDEDAEILFKGINYCMDCGFDKAHVLLKFDSKINNFGGLLENFNYGQLLQKGSGTALGLLQWRGKLQDFDITKSTAKIKMDLKDGEFLKVNTGGLFGKLLGLINLQTVVNLAKLNFSSIFANGFYFNKLAFNAAFINNKIDLQNFMMQGSLATVRSKGKIDINKDQVDLSLVVTPNLGTTVAIGAGVATLNPIVGVAAYALEWLLGEPINKLFKFNFDVTGTIDAPKIEQIGVKKQVVNNVNSAVTGTVPAVGNVVPRISNMFPSKTESNSFR